MPTRMTAVDAQFYWMSAKVPSDEFLLYAFDGEPTDFERAVDEVRNRAQNCRALTLRVEDGSPLTYPRWVSTAIEQDQVLLHHLDDASWGGCLDAVARLADDQLDIRRASWRMHLFAPVHGIPGSTGPATVAVMQFAHALSDGPRALAMAAWLFGRATPVPEVPTRRRASCRGAASLRRKPIASRCAIPAPGCCRRRSERSRRCPPMPARRARAQCARCCGIARS